MRVSYKRAAVKDMEATRDYIAGRLKNPKAAKKLMTALLKAISLLADNPYMGAALAEKFEITTDEMCIRDSLYSVTLMMQDCFRDSIIEKLKL